MASIWHIALAVPNLDKAMKELGDALMLTWRPIEKSLVQMRGEDGQVYDLECTFTFSEGGPAAIELWEAIPGSPLGPVDGMALHHIGYWVDDLPGEAKRLEGLGYPTYAAVPASGPPTRVTIHRGPYGLMLEPCGTERDRPHLHDLYPTESPLYEPAKK